VDTRSDAHRGRSTRRSSAAIPDGSCQLLRVRWTLRPAPRHVADGGPIAHRPADATADASGKLAERSRTWAAELRNKIDDAGNGSGDQSGGATTAVLEGADDPVELAAKDDPAEGSRE